MVVDRKTMTESDGTVMSLFTWLAFLAAVLTAWVHTVLGHQGVHKPIQRKSTADELAKGTIAVCWHFVTVVLIAQALFLGAVAVQVPMGEVEGRLLQWLIVGLNGTFVLVFMATSKLTFKRWFTLPQPSLLAPISLFTFLGIWPMKELIPVSAHAATLVSAGLLVLAVAIIHVVWGLGSSWPAKDSSRLLELVVGMPAREGFGVPPARFPSRGVTLLVAAMMGAAALLLIVQGVSLDLLAGFENWLIGACWTLFAIFLIRGLGGYAEGRMRPFTNKLPYGFWNKALYSPLCLLISALILSGNLLVGK